MQLFVLLYYVYILFLIFSYNCLCLLCQLCFICPSLKTDYLTHPSSLFQLNKEASTKSESEQANGFIEKSPIYVTSYPPEFNSQTSTSTTSSAVIRPIPVTTAVTPSTSQAPCLSNGGPPVVAEEPETSEIELKQDIGVGENKVVPRRASSPFSNGRTEVLIGQDAVGGDTRVKTTAIVENHRSPGLGVAEDCVTR